MVTAIISLSAKNDIPYAGNFFSQGMELQETFVSGKNAWNFIITLFQPQLLMRFHKISGNFLNCLSGRGGYEWRGTIRLGFGNPFGGEGNGTTFLAFRNLKGGPARHDLKKKCQIPFSGMK